MKPNVAGAITGGFAEFAFNISQETIMNIDLTLAVVTKNALHGIFQEMVAEIVMRKCQLASLW